MLLESNVFISASTCTSHSSILRRTRLSESSDSSTYARGVLFESRGADTEEGSTDTASSTVLRDSPVSGQQIPQQAHPKFLEANSVIL